jgi:hypothetical protein
LIVNVRGIRRFFRRRGADLVVAGLIVGWVVACAKKKASAPPAAPAPAALAEASPAPAAPLPDPTAATIAGLEVVAARGECIDYPDFTTKMRHARDLEWSELKSSIRAGAVSPEVTTEWLVLAHHYQSVCDSNYEPEEINARELLADFTPIPERLIDRALKERRCGFLGALDELEMWPYEVQFADEVQERDFAGAEVTRVLWRDTLSNYVEACGEAISRRGSPNSIGSSGSTIRS